MNKHKKIVNLISKETGLSKASVNLIVKYFFLGLRRIMYKNGEINLFGLFKLKLKKSAKKKVEKDPNINLRKRRCKGYQDD